MEKNHILIVEDNQINALVLRKALEKDYQCVHVINDKQAFEAVKKQDFSIILMDINLGGNSLDGEEIMKTIKKDPAYQHIKIFAVTSYAMPGDKERFLSAGFDRYYSKPISKPAILAGIEETLKLSAV